MYNDYSTHPTTIAAKYARAEAAERNDKILAICMAVGLFVVLIFTSLFVGCL